MTTPLRRWSTNAERRWESLGALAPRHVVWGLIIIFSAWVVLDVLVLKLTTGLANSTYDTMVRKRLVADPPDPRILIVDIDEASLLAMSREFGRWPWPRDTLATVLDYLEQQQPAAIVWDIVFSDADRLSPGGDKAFNDAVARSTHSHFPVVRLPASNDRHSQSGPAQLPGLWLKRPLGEANTATPQNLPTAALIVPVLPAVAASRLGYNNGYPDRDGVLRRYRYLDEVDGTWALKSIPYSVAQALDPAAAAAIDRAHARRPDGLIAWRAQANSYPRVPFSEVFAVADGGKSGALPAFTGRIIIIGATAPSLHDIHPTPLSPLQAGVDSLATAIDNGLNQRHLDEEPRWLQAVLAILLCAGLAFWVRRRGIAALDAALLVLPAGLLAVSFISLNLAPVFIDLYLSAALGLIFLALLRYWNNLRRSYWCDWEADRMSTSTPLALWSFRSRRSWTDARLDRLIDAVAAHMPQCRVLVADTQVVWPGRLRWPELSAYAAIVGPRADIEAAQRASPRRWRRLTGAAGDVVALPAGAQRDEVVACALREWTRLQPLSQDNSIPGAL